MAWIKVFGEDEATDEVREVYESIREAFGRLSPAFTVMSLRPRYLRTLWDLHRAVMSEGQLGQVEKEVIALTVSAVNRCGYCVWAHSNRLRAMGLDPAAVEQIMRNPEEANLEGRLRAIVRWAVKATKAASEMSEADVEELRRVGLSDEAILEAAAVVGHFNHLNKVLDALGVEAPS